MRHDIFVGNSRNFHRSAKIKSYANKLPPQKIPRKCTLLFTVLNFNEIGCKQCNENDHMAFVFVTFKYRTWNPRKIWNPNSQKICLSKLENSNSHEELMPHGTSIDELFYLRGLTKITTQQQEHTATVNYLILGCVSNNHPVVLGSEILSHMKSIKRYITNFGYKLT